jgi:hypothetical protein
MLAPMMVSPVAASVIFPLSVKGVCAEPMVLKSPQENEERELNDANKKRSLGHVGNFAYCSG